MQTYNQAYMVPENLSEGIRYGLPTLLYKGKGLLSLAITKKYLSLYPHSGVVVTQLHNELAGYVCTAGTIRFTLEKPLTPQLVELLLQTRKQEIEEQVA